MNAKKIFLLTACLLLPFLLNASLEQNFKKMNMQNGLAGNSVYSIFKDKDGFIWFGTGDGLSRYDGKNIRSFTSDKYNMTIEHMYDTSDGLLLFITSNNLHCFDRYRECFVETASFRDMRYYNTRGLVLLNDSIYWSISKNKLHLLKRVLGRSADNKTSLLSLEVLKEFVLTDEAEIIYTFCESQDKKKLFLVTEKSKLLIFDLQTEKLDAVVTLFTSRPDSYQISSLVCDKDYLWMSTIGGGVLRYHLRNHSLDSFTRNSSSKQYLSHDDVYALIAVGDKYIAATWNGYTVLSLDRKNGGVTTEINNQLSRFSYNLESRMLSAYYDSQGLLYFGTHGGGVMILDLREKFYERFCQSETSEICDIVSDDKGNIWMATFHGEILCSDSPFDPSKPLSFSPKNTPIVEGKAVLCAMKDEEGNLWFGNSDASITCYQSSSGKFMNYNLPYEYRKNNNLKYSTYVWQLFMDSKYRFWVGTRNGLLLFDRETKNFSPVLTVEGKPLEKHSIRAIVEGLNGELWIGTPDGLYKLVLNVEGKAEIKGNYEVAVGTAARYVRALHASTDGQLYIGYTEGLGILAQNKDSIQHFYTTRDGMCSNFVTCITEDENGHIWLGTNSGISRYSRHQNLFYNYYISGSNRSVLQAANTLFFGNNYALTYFNPETVEMIPSIKKNLLLDLEVNNKHVAIGEKRNGQVILQKGLPYTDELTLAYANRDFSLSFSNLLYSEEHQKYNYRLLPYQNEWVVCNGGEKAAYTNLPAGDYVFEVKSVYPDGTDSVVNTLAIRILPHWSQTIWFRLCVLLVILLITGYAVHRVRREQRRAKRELLLKHELHISNMEREQEKQIREERENFFTCVAHELRTPLTLVLSPLQELLHRKTNADPDYKALSLMYENGNSLHRLVDDLLSVQKIEAGMMKLCLSEVNVVALLKETANTFRQMAVSRKIDFVLDLPDKSIPLWVDIEKVASAVRNLLSNAFKYTEAGGNITLAVMENTMDEKDYCRIVVSDTGRGIPVELQHRVFDSFVTGGAAPSFSTKVGIGLRIVKNTMDMHHGTVDLQSELGKGSSFSLNFPKGKAHFADDNCEETVYQPTTADNASPTDEPVVPEQVNKEELSAARYKTTLLVVEDNPDIRQYIVSLFQNKYNVLEAADGEEGVQQAMRHLPDLIISDIMMPIKDGFACCKEIREQVETAHIPILMLTAKAEDADIIRGAQLGVDDYMMKPFNPEILKAKVENLILRREHLKRIYTKSLMLKQTAQETEGDDFMQKVINVIEANLANEDFSVQMLAERLNMSQPTLYRKIKERSELSIIKVIRSIRMSKAASLIMEHKYSVLEISEMVGFNDPNTFRKHFIEQFGVLPSKYDERSKGEEIDEQQRQ